MQVRVRTIEGAQVVATAREHAVILDQPADRGGNNTGFRPTELYLAGLAGCMIYTAKRYAAERNLALEEIIITAEEATQVELPVMDVKVDLKGTLSDDERKEILAYIQQNCKVLGLVTSAVKVNISDNLTEETMTQGATGNSCAINDGCT